jgi:hypothetical protein
MSKSIAKQVQSETSKRLAAARKRIEESRNTAIAVRGTSALVTGLALGEAERRGMPTVIAGTVPLRALIGVGAAFGAAFTKGTTSAALDGIAAATMGVYGYEAAQKRTFIAGEIGSSHRSRTYV